MKLTKITDLLLVTDGKKNLIYANQKLLKNRVKIISDAKVSCILFL